MSAQKYLASPTAGLIIGRAAFVSACRAQETGIGRAMKATKEALVGVLAALEERRALDLEGWIADQHSKVRSFVDEAKAISGISAHADPDPAGMPFSRVRLRIDPQRGRWTAPALALALQRGSPSIRVMEHAATEGDLVLELVPLATGELREIIDRLRELMSQGPTPLADTAGPEDPRASDLIQVHHLPIDDGCFCGKSAN